MAAVNPQVLAQFVGSDPAMIARFLQMFLATATQGMAEMRGASARRSAVDIVTQAHKLKSAAHTVGAVDFADLCVQLERTGKAADWVAMDAVLARLKAEFAAVDSFIAAHDPAQAKAGATQP